MSSDLQPSGASGEADANTTLADDDRSVEGARVLAHVMTGLFGADAAEPVRIGRFVVLRRLGAGAMGEVYAAYDGELDRKVAIKLLRARPDAEHLQARLRREAQAIAKLAHPNVVPVFEVGDDGGRLFLVMEMIEGTTLRGWLREVPRSRDAILDVFEQAGRGLVAAHSASLVHRDLKPDNILVGNDGRVRLVDFGLARAEPGERAAASTSSATHDSTVAGTPRYMAPEQFLGARVDHRADQFAFCVSLYEALYRVPPFDGSSITVVASKVLAGQIDPPPQDHDVPLAIARLLRRGLARAPEQRFADMQSLLDELQRARGAARRRALAIVVGLAAAGALAFVVVDQRAKAACRDEGTRATASWQDARNDIETAIRGTGVPFAEPTIARIGRELDARTVAWAEARAANCLARRSDRDGDLVTRAQDCLDERLLEQNALTKILGAADVIVASTAVHAVTGLQPIADCTDVRRLAQRPAAPDPEQRARVAELAPAIADAVALGTAGRWADAHSAAIALLPDAERVNHPPQLAELLRQIGDAKDRMGDLAGAEEQLRAAYFLAGRHELRRIAGFAALGLASTVGIHAQRVDEGLAWLDHAEMMVGELDDAQLRVGLAYERGGLLLQLGEFREATASLAEAAALAEAELGADNPEIGSELIALGSAYSSSNEPERARETLARARALLEASLGPAHPLVAGAIHNLANEAQRRGKFDEAAQLNREALAIREAAFPGDNIEKATSLSGLGGALAAGGDVAGGQRYFADALAMSERVLGKDHPRLVYDLDNLGLTYLMQGRTADALPLFERACTLVEGSQRDTVQHAVCLENLADANTELGQHARALALYEQALEIRARRSGKDHPETAKVRMNMATVLAKLERHDEALAIYRETYDVLLRALDETHPLVVEARGHLSRAEARAQR
ncbi:MAG TPA: tetratricopeptide repeat protein [Nannocystaceae bacterium]|nr:tetratricopeptide repeat protein [Nannocystaceae bacterium]